MGTGCNVQEGMSGEYYSAAEATIALRATGLALEPALRQVFDEQFWPGCLQADHRQAHLQTLLQTVAELERLEPAESGHRMGRRYIRFAVNDRPGVLAEITQ